MQETWRWFGPDDPVTLTDVVQAGASGVVTALHDLPPGRVWGQREVVARRDLIAKSGASLGHALHWQVVESLPVSEDIKRQSGDWREHVDAYKTSLSNLAAAGIETICYNFMPVIDWTRTDLAYRLPNKATCMRFDLVDFAVFDLFLLRRPQAHEELPKALIDAAHRRVSEMTTLSKTQLVHNVIAGLPGGAAAMSLQALCEHLESYSGVTRVKLAQHQLDFIELVAPHAQDLGLKLCCHPDDPPVPLLGLPRVMSTEAEYTRLVKEVDLPSNGITLCSGSLGALAENDLPGMMKRLGTKVHFLHLRNVKREHSDNFGSFHESEHLNGSVNMPKLISAILDEEHARRDAGRADWSIPFRPDHGQAILTDLTTKTQPGYPAIGRLKGLAELRGVIAGLSVKGA